MSWSRRYGWVLLSVLAVSMAALVLTAVVPVEAKGSGKRPPGWDKGEKKGWQGGDMPPGLAKKGGWMPPGLSMQDQEDWETAGGPPGWSKGRKVGWRGGTMPPGLAKLAEEGRMPPGWVKWDKEKQECWESDLDEAREAVIEKSRGIKELTEEDQESALISVEMALRTGVPVKHSKSIVVGALARGIKGEGVEKVTRAVAYGVGREIDFDQLGKYVHEKLNEGLPDDDLAIEIYKGVARRHEEKMRAKEAIQEEKEKGKKK
ncbi:hypothetical protein ES702_05068 [subsurface metagenome]